MYALLGPALAPLASLVPAATDSGTTDWPRAVWIAIAIIAGAVVIAVLTYQIFGTARAAISSDGDSKYQQELQNLTQRSIASNEAAAKELAELTQGMADLRARITAVEKLLREVD